MATYPSAPVYPANPTRPTRAAVYPSTSSSRFSSASGTVAAGITLATLPADMLGLNCWFGDPLSMDAGNAALYSALGCTVLRMNAQADIYHDSPPAGSNAGAVALYGSDYAHLTTGFGPATPAFIVLTDAGTGAAGTLSGGGTFGYRMAAVVNVSGTNYELPASPEAVISVAAGHKVQVTCLDKTGMTGCNVYGRTAGGEILIGTATKSGGDWFWIDDGSATPGAQTPSGSAIVLGSTGISMSAWVNNVVKAMSPQPRVIVLANHGSNAAGTAPNPASETVALVQALQGLGVTVAAVEFGNERYAAAAKARHPTLTTTTEGGVWCGSGEKSAYQYGQDALALMNAMQTAGLSVPVVVALYPDGYAGLVSNPYTAADDAYFAGLSHGTGLGWCQSVLSVVGAHPLLGGVQFHYFPEYYGPTATDQVALQTTLGIPSVAAQIGTYIQTYCTTPSAVKFYMTATAPSGQSYATKQGISYVGGLWHLDNAAGWLSQSKTQSVCLFDAHILLDPLHGDPQGIGLAGGYGFGSFALFSAGASAGGMSEPPAQTPYPPAQALRLLPYWGRPGDSVVYSTPTTGQLVVRACKHTAVSAGTGSADAKLGVLLINKDQTPSAVTLSLSGFTPAGTATSYSFGLTQQSTLRRRTLWGLGATSTLQIDALTATVVLFD